MLEVLRAVQSRVSLPASRFKTRCGATTKALGRADSRAQVRVADAVVRRRKTQPRGQGQHFHMTIAADGGIQLLGFDATRDTNEPDEQAPRGGFFAEQGSLSFGRGAPVANRIPGKTTPFDFETGRGGRGPGQYERFSNVFYRRQTRARSDQAAKGTPKHLPGRHFDGLGTGPSTRLYAPDDSRRGVARRVGRGRISTPGWY